MNNRFLELVEANKGFEYTIGFRENEDHFIGGTGNTVWYCIIKGRRTECWIGEYKGDVWTDKHILKQKELREEPAAPGTAMAMILERAYFRQSEIAAANRKPVPVTLYDLKCSHYVFSFGARAYDISDDYGITFCYSNIGDEKAGWRLRDAGTGKKVRPPKFK